MLEHADALGTDLDSSCTKFMDGIGSKEMVAGPSPAFAKAILEAMVVGGSLLSTDPWQHNFILQVGTFLRGAIPFPTVVDFPLE